MYIYKYVCNWAAQSLRQTQVYYPFASTHMVNTQSYVSKMCIQNHKYFRGFLNSRLLNLREIREN